MQTVKSLDPADAAGKTKELFDAVRKNLGGVPNLMRTLGNSPAALHAYLSFEQALGRGTLTAKLREQIAVAVASLNGCDYCLRAHHAFGERAGLSAKDLELARNAGAEDEKAAAALHFAAELVRRRGQAPAGEVDALRAAGFGDGEIVEIAATVGINLFTNYFNLTAQTEIDFPAVRSQAA